MSEKQLLLSSENLINVIKEMTNNLILYFSAGKDSLAAWLYLRDKGFNIIPVYLYTVPGLRSDEENLSYYESFFNSRIMRLPHFLFYKSLKELVFQTPDRVAQIRAWSLPSYGYHDIDTLVARDKHLDTYYAAMGMRMADNLERRMSMYQVGVYGTKKRKFYYPIWDWNVEQVSTIINDNNVKIPKIYKYSGRTIFALDYYYMKQFRIAYPDDYQRMLDWFPLLEAEFYRYERLRNG